MKPYIRLHRLTNLSLILTLLIYFKYIYIKNNIYYNTKFSYTFL